MAKPVLATLLGYRGKTAMEEGGAFADFHAHSVCKQDDFVTSLALLSKSGSPHYWLRVWVEAEVCGIKVVCSNGGTLTSGHPNLCSRGSIFYKRGREEKEDEEKKEGKKEGTIERPNQISSFKRKREEGRPPKGTNKKVGEKEEKSFPLIATLCGGHS
jgi:hypothetical protein